MNRTDTANGGLLSVIIPIYKTPKGSLERCLRSVARLPSDKVEVICIVDGPNALDHHVLEDIASQSFMFHIVKNERNEGVSYSRNRGLRLAHGTFVAFVDADDEIVADTYMIALENCIQNNLDVCEFLCIGGKSFADMPHGALGYATWTEDENRLFLLRAITCARMSSVAGIFRRRLIVGHDISFDTDLRYNEDFVFITRMFQAANRIGVLNLPGYHIVGHSASASRSAVTEKRFIDCVKAGTRVIKALNASRMNVAERRWYLRLVIREELFPVVAINKYLTRDGRVVFITYLIEVLTLMRSYYFSDFYSISRLVLSFILAHPNSYFLPPFFIPSVVKLLQRVDRIVLPTNISAP